MKKVFSKREICKFLVTYHGLNQLNVFGTGKEGIVNYLNKINSIQTDPLNIIGKNAEIIFHSRFSDFNPEMLNELLYKDNLLIDGYDKEACIYLSKDWNKFSNIRKEMANYDIRVLNYRNNQDALNHLDDVYDFILNNPNTTSKDYKISGGGNGRWGSSNLSNCALNHLWCKGIIGISKRKQNIKYYSDIKLIIKAEELDNDLKDFNSFMEWYIIRRLNEIGVYWLKRGAGWQGFFLKDLTLVKAIIDKLVIQNEIIEIEIDGFKEKFYLTNNAYKELIMSLDIKLKENIRFIAPLDNMIWDRKVVKKLFDFEYTWEVYIPENKRKYGYYVLPILYRDKIIGRFEPKRDKGRKDKLMINKIWFGEEKYNCDYIRKLIDKEVIRYNCTFK